MHKIKSLNFEFKIRKTLIYEQLKRGKTKKNLNL